jgi:hypothetical protein
VHRELVREPRGSRLGARGSRRRRND